MRMLCICLDTCILGLKASITPECTCFKLFSSYPYSMAHEGEHAAGRSASRGTSPAPAQLGWQLRRTYLPRQLHSLTP